MKVFSLYFLFLSFAIVLASIQTPLKSTIVGDALDRDTSISEKFQEAMLKTPHGIDLKEHQDQLAAEPQELEKEYPKPLPENQTERYKQQKTMITHALDKCEDALVDVCGHWKIPGDTVRTNFGKIKPYIIHALLIIARYPKLLLILLGVAIIPENFILRRIFTCLGFGPLGPVKGSIAARAQSFFYGGAVPKGNWFAWLQRAGTMNMGLGGLVIKILIFHSILRLLHIL
ncbi:hypothetical protein BYT27DRAFT_7206858 [Phlegmacium glaucopus]|nr:hypothetical protein BYT27DRAFT_7206858 [Phlegmacium glaucopus]